MQGKRGIFAAWVKYVPFLLLPFLVLFYEVTLHRQILFNGYESNDLRKEVGLLKQSIDTLRAEEASLEAMDRIKERAPELGLVKPDPRQIRVIRAQVSPQGTRGEPHYDMASLDPRAEDNSADAAGSAGTNTQ
jgi:hypothetical protein